MVNLLFVCWFSDNTFPDAIFIHLFVSSFMIQSLTHTTCDLLAQLQHHVEHITRHLFVGAVTTQFLTHCVSLTCQFRLTVTKSSLSLQLCCSTCLLAGFYADCWKCLLTIVNNFSLFVFQHDVQFVCCFLCWSVENFIKAVFNIFSLRLCSAWSSVC